MTSFHEVALPLPFALGATGGPERRVDVITLGSGAESRNTPWRQSRRRYDIGGAVRSADDLAQLIAFFEARRGKLHGFRFRDFLDHKSCLPSQIPTPLDQTLGVGDGARTSFQLIKTYGDAARKITKPVAETLSLSVAGLTISASAFSVDAATGMITLSTPPLPGALVKAGYLFDTPVRFDADRLDITLDGLGAGHAASVPLVELLV